MAARIVKTLPKSGTVSRAKVRAAARHMLKTGKAKYKKGVVTRTSTASSRKQIAFNRYSFDADY
jgi:hypothetical protein